MILTLLVLTATFTTVFSLVYWNARQDIDKKLLALPSCAIPSNIKPISSAGSVAHYVTNIVINGEHIGSSIFFKITVTNNGAISKSNLDYQFLEGAYRKAAQEAWIHQNIHHVISLGRTKWQAIVTPSSCIKGEYDIFFMDVTGPQALLKNLLQTFLGIAPLALFAIFLISRKIANRSILPISEAWEKQRQFIADASHELKTPLAIIHANTEALLLDTESNSKNRQKWIRYIKDETIRMSRLIKELLYMAKVEENPNHEIYTEFDFGQCISDMCTALEAIIYEKNIILDCDIAENIIIYSSEQKINKLLTILLDNAIKYNTDGGFIHVNLQKQRMTAEVCISNSGSGIPAEDLPHIFERFYRADKARENSDGSYGLGLSIAKIISEQLNGKLTVHSTPNGITTFKFQIRAT